MTDTPAELERLPGEPQAALLVAVAFWDSFGTSGYGRDPRMLRYVKAL